MSDTLTDGQQDQAPALELVAPLEAEVATEDEHNQPDIGYPKGTVTTVLDGKTIHVLPVEDWPTAATSALNRGDFDAWAEVALAGDDFDTVWLEVRDGNGPTIGQASTMFEDWGAKTGQSQGKSGSLRRSSRTGRRR